MINIVTASRIIEITEKKSRFHRIKEFSSNWKMVIIISVGALTLKIAAEQMAMMLIRGN